ncbi:MAG: Flp pilus assembly protein CpaB [Sandaracinaceae bacterium]
MNRTLLIASGALIAAGIVMFYVYADAYIEQETGGERIPVVVATQDIPFGEPMQSAWLSTRLIPQRYVEDRHLRANQLRRLIGVPLATSVRAGEAVLRTDLSVLSDLERTLSGEVPSSMRALAITAQPESSHAGLLRPGDRVDVLLIVATPREPNSGRAIVVAQKLMVLSVGHAMVREYDADRGRPTTSYNTQVNLEVSLEDAQRLTLARRQGQLRVLLRNANDASEIERPVDVRAPELLQHERRQEWLRRFALAQRPAADPDLELPAIAPPPDL